MMILKHPKIDQDVLCTPGKVFNIVIENSLFFRELMTDLKEQLSTGVEHFLLYEGREELDLSKEGYLIETPLTIEIDDKKVALAVQKDVASRIDEGQREKYFILLQQISVYMSDISYDYPLPLSFDSEMSLSSFLKAMALSPENTSATFLDSLLESIKRLAFVFRIHLFFFVNLQDYMTANEFETFLNEMNRLELFPIMISTHLPQIQSPREFLIRIDSDLCELHIEPNKEKA
jgi:CRISPR type II-A-associated protein Csn2